MKKYVSGILVLALASGAFAATGVTNFTDLTLAADSYWNGSDGSGFFASGSASFNNNYNSTYDSWGGFAYSNVTDNTTEGWGNQYSSITGGGYAGPVYGVAFYDQYTPTVPVITLNTPTICDGIWLTNDTYTYYSILKGDFFASPISEGGYYKVVITGYDATGANLGQRSAFLADYTSSNPANRYIVDDWIYLDLSGLGEVKTLEFGFEATDGNWPTYAIVGQVVPEPACISLLALGGLAVLRRRKVA